MYPRVSICVCVCVNYECVWGPFHLQFFHHNSNVMEISFCSHPNNNIVIATIFGTWHDSWAVVACAKFCRDMITSNWIKAKWNFHRIWIVYNNISPGQARRCKTEGWKKNDQNPCCLGEWLTLTFKVKLNNKHFIIFGFISRPNTQLLE